MRTLPICCVIVWLLPACQGSVVEGVQASSTGTIAGTGAAGGAPTSGAGGSMSGAGGSTSTGNSSTGAGGAPACTFSTSGAVALADLTPDSVSGFILGPNMFECGTAPGSADELVIYLGAGAALTVGSHPAPYAGSYGWEHCGAQGCVHFENDGAPWQAGGCAVDITVAPQGDAAGQPIAGTFSCATLI